MKQILFTFCEGGRSITGRNGDGARAASAGVASFEADQFLNYTLYETPDTKLHRLKVDENRFVDEAPVSLRYRSAGESDYAIVAHTVYAKGRRPGNFFSHVLFDLPPEFSPMKAVELWKNPHWQTRDDPSIHSPLTDWNVLDADGSVTEKTFCDFLCDVENQDFFQFLLHAWMHRTPEQKIVLVANPEKIVFAIWGVLRCLPKEMWKSMSFSTYERVSSVFHYDITGFWNPKLIAAEESLIEQLSQSTDMIALWNPPSQHGYIVAEPERELEKYIVCQCVSGNFTQIDALWKEMPNGFGDSLGHLEIHRLASTSPSQLSENQLAEAKKWPGIGKIIEKNLAHDEQHCQVIVEEWLVEGSSTSKLQFLLDEYVESPSLQKYITKRIESRDIELIKMVLTKPPSRVISFQEVIWDTLDPEKLNGADLKFFRPFAFSWFNDRQNRREMEAWSVIRSIEDMAEALKPHGDTAVNFEHAVYLCSRFCFPDGTFNPEKADELMCFLMMNHCELAVATLLDVCITESHEPTKVFLDGLFQNCASAALFVKILAKRIGDTFHRTKGRLPKNVVSCLDQIIRSKAIDTHSQLLFTPFFSEEQQDSLAEVLMEREGIKNIRQNKQMQGFVLNRLKKRSKAGCAAAILLFPLFVLLSFR